MAANSALVTGGGVQIVDFYATTLTQGLEPGATTMFVGSVAGIPSLSETSYCLFLIEEGTKFEIVKGIGINAALKTITIARAYGGTEAGSFTREAKVEMRMTSAVMNEFARAANTNYLEERFLATKATVDSLSTVATTGAYSDLTGSPTLFPVATTGSFNDLSNKPDIAAEARAAISIDDTSAEGVSYNQANGAIHISSVSSPGDIGALVFGYLVGSSAQYVYGSVVTLSSSVKIRPAGISPDESDGSGNDGIRWPGVTSYDLTTGNWKCLGYSMLWTDLSDGPYDKNIGSGTLAGDGLQYVLTLWHRIA